MGGSGGELRRRATLREVAELAGVAPKTVSRVVNGVATVDPVLAARVKDAASQLSYRPNLAASSLRRNGGRTNTVGLLVEDVSNPFSAAVHRGAEIAAAERGVQLLTSSVNEDAALEQLLARTLIDRRVDGLLIVPTTHDHSWVVAEERSGTPFVFIDRRPTPLVSHCVTSDHRRGARAGVRHLVEGGHRRIAYLGDSMDIDSARERFHGYADALNEAGLPLDRAIINTEINSTVRAYETTGRLLDAADAPTAIFASQNMVWVAAVRALHERQMQHKVALVGFDDLPLTSLINPGITVIAQDATQIGRLAIRELFMRLDGSSSEPGITYVPTTLIPRGSGEIRRV